VSPKADRVAAARAPGAARRTAVRLDWLPGQPMVWGGTLVLLAAAVLLGWSRWRWPGAALAAAVACMVCVVLVFVVERAARP
jgi:hypothetical protein